MPCPLNPLAAISARHGGWRKDRRAGVRVAAFDPVHRVSIRLQNRVGPRVSSWQ